MGSIGLIELVVVFGVVLVLACYDLVRLRRDMSRDDGDDQS